MKRSAFTLLASLSVLSGSLGCTDDSNDTSDIGGSGANGPGPAGGESAQAGGPGSGAGNTGGAGSADGGNGTGGSGGTSTFDPGKLCEVTPNDTPLKIAAREMTGGEWRNIPVQYPGGQSREEFFLSSTGANNHVDYAESGSWDPDGRCIFYYGGGHNSQPVFIRWCESDSTWAELNRPGWIDFESSNIYEWFVHAYDRNTFDPETRQHFFVAGSVWTYDVESGEWTEGPETVADPGFAGNGADHFPGMGLVEVNQESGNVALLPSGSSQWEVLFAELDISYHPFIEHNRTSQLMLLGGGTGGSGSNNVYVLDASKEVHGPFVTDDVLGTINYGSGGFVTEDPHSGGFIFLSTQGEVSRLDVTTTGVTRVSLPDCPADVLTDTGEGPLIPSGISVPIADYGVIAYVLGHNDESLWIYKPAGEPCP